MRLSTLMSESLRSELEAYMYRLPRTVGLYGLSCVGTLMMCVPTQNHRVVFTHTQTLIGIDLVQHPFCRPHTPDFISSSCSPLTLVPPIATAPPHTAS